MVESKLTLVESKLTFFKMQVKSILNLILFFSILLLQVPAFSNDFSGTTWALTGVGCRDGSLSERSHVSRSSISGDVTAGIFHFVDDNRVNMTITLRGEEQVRSGTYRVNGTNIVMSSGLQGMTLPIVGRELIVIGSRTESAQECCPAKHVEGWRERKQNLKDRESKGETSRTTWEEEKAEHGWDEDWLANDKEEFDRLKTKCRDEKPFVYVLEEV